MEKKYEFTNGTIEVGDVTLRRIIAIRDFGSIKAGTVGGYIEKESNLSHKGTCWIGENAKVFQNATVKEDAIVSDNAVVYGSAEISVKAKISGHAHICGHAKIYGNGLVSDYARIYDNAKVFIDAAISGNASIGGNVFIYGNAQVCGNINIYGNASIFRNAYVCGDITISGNTSLRNDAYICSNNDIFCASYIGSRKSCTTFYVDKDRNIMVSCGCFTGTLEEFEEAIRETHGDNKYGKEYELAINMAKLHILN